MESIITAVFSVESEAYQAITELRNRAVTDEYAVLQAALIKKENGQIVPCDGYDTGINTTDDTLAGGLIGGLVGILGGPLGILLGGAWGSLIGSTIDAGDAADSLSLIEAVSSKLEDGETALIALVSEESSAAFDNALSKFNVRIERRDAAVVAQEVEDARELEEEMQKEARRKMREAKKAEKKEKIEEKRAKVKADIEAFKAKHSK